MTFSRKAESFGLALLFSSAIIPPHAAIAQTAGSLDLFADGTLNGWTTAGGASVTGTTVTLNLGVSPFTLTPAPGESMAVIQPQLSLTTIDSIDAALGLSAGTMLSATGTGNVTINGVGANLTTTTFGYISKQLTLSQGSYTFYWAYAAQDYLPYTDGVFFSIAGNGLNTVDLLARNGAAGITAGSTGYPAQTVILQSYGSTSFIAQTFTIDNSGTYQLGFGDFNAIDSALDPILFVASKLGTTTGTVVITNPPAPPAIPDIDTAVSYYSSTDLAANAVNPVFAGGTLKIVAGGTIGNNFTVQSLGGAIDTDGNAIALTGTLSGSGSLVKRGAGTLQLMANNSGFSGDLYVNGGTLELGDTGAAGTGTIHAVNPTIAFAADGTYANNVSLEVASPASANGTVFRNTSGHVVTLSGAITTGTGNNINGDAVAIDQYVTFSGGPFALTNAGNNWTGDTTIDSDAALALSGGASIANSARLVNNGIFDIAGAGGVASVASLAGSGVVTLGDNTLTITHANDTFAGTIAGAGGLVLGAGTQTLSGTNSYTGGTVLSDGTLALAGDGTLGDTSGTTTVIGGGTLDLGGTSQVQNGGVTLAGGTIQNGTLASSSTFALQGGTVSATLAGTGGVHQSSGTTTLSGTNTYTGGTVVSGGTLALTGSGAVVSSSLTVDGTFDISGIADQGTSVVDLDGSGSVVLGSKALTVSAGTGTFSGVLSGAGQFGLSGGTLTLTGANSYSGGTTIAGGTLKGTSTSLQGAILNDSALEFIQATDGTYAGSITGTGTLAKSGSGALTLTGSSAIGGATIVSAGRLAVNGTLATGGLTVANGAVLSGSGTITMASDGILAVSSGATLAPGNSPGTLMVNGSVTLASGSTMAVDIDGASWSAGGGAGSYDRLVVNGTVTLGGTIVPTLRGITGAATNSYTPALGSRYTVVSATAVKGTFDTVVQPASGLAANTRFDALYTDTTAQLVVTPVSFGSLGATSGWNSNTRATATALDSLRGNTANGSLFDALYGLDAAGYERAFSQISGQIYADALQGYASAANTALGTVRDQLNQGGYVGARGEQGVQLWTRYINSHEAPGDSARGNGNSATTRGFIAGATLVDTPRLRFGVAGGYTHTRINTGLGAEASGAGAVGYLYGRYAPAAFVDLSAIGGFASGTMNASRTIATARDTVRASGNARVTVAQLAVDARLRAVQAGGFAAYALAGVQLGNASSGQVSETASNSAFALTLPHSGWNTLDSRVGGQLVQTFASARLSAYGTLLTQLGDAPTASRTAVLNGAAWTVQSTGLAKSGMAYGAAVSANLARNLSVQASYDGVDRGKSYRNHRMSAGVSFAF